MKIGRAAAAALFALRDELRFRRQEAVKTWVSTQFDFGAIPGALKVCDLHFQLQHDYDFTIQSLRDLEQIFAELQPLAEA